MANRLADATSPYLQQHADNPVDWRPWGEDAFEEARRRDVPVFLSVGYSACHWCHVMAHESFEDDQVAAVMNERFVNVKVDREERPDVDAVYMQAVQSMTGHGGWPMSVFLTPGGAPFFAGTYWPKEPRAGMPDFPKVLGAVSEAWHERRDEVLGSAEKIATAIAEHREGEPAEQVDPSIVDAAARTTVAAAWDRERGGFGRAPKFPQAMTVEWLLHHHARTGAAEPLEAAVHSLDAMARGGIHDQLAGGFARYSTDASWLVPHFEKMLYDNALLLPAYAAGAVIADREDLARVARSTAHYLLGELRTADGTFVSATDADSEGVEGRYFVWPYDELVAVLADVGVDPDRWTAFLGARPAGNWEGVNVLHEPVPRASFAQQQGMEPDAFEAEWERVRAALLEQRAQRVPPGVDDKVLTDWNALAIRGLVRAGGWLDEPGWVAAGVAAAERLHADHVIDGRLHHAGKAGKVHIDGFLEDHALLALADLELLQASGDPRWFEHARWLATEAHERFHDADEGGWFQTAHDAEELYARPKDRWDNAVPAGTSVMIEVCLLLAGLTGDLAWRDRAEEGLKLFQPNLEQMAIGYGWTLRQLESLAAGPREIAIVGQPGDDRARLEAVARRTVRPGTLVLVADPDHGDRIPLLEGRGEVEGRPAAYVCRQMVCDRPVTDAQDLATLLDG